MPDEPTPFEVTLKIRDPAVVSFAAADRTLNSSVVVPRLFVAEFWRRSPCLVPVVLTAILGTAPPPVELLYAVCKLPASAPANCQLAAPFEFAHTSVAVAPGLIVAPPMIKLLPAAAMLDT
jgi:hypothetical protein